MLIYMLLLACSGDDGKETTPGPTDVADADADADGDTDADSDTDTDASGTTGDTASGLVGTAPLQFHGSRPKNVLMISIDTFRKDHVTRWGGSGETDWIDSLIDEGVVMDNHFTCSNWTFPGLSCTILGRYHEDNGYVPVMSPVLREPFPDDLPFIARTLRDAGYHTAVTSRNGWFSAEWNNVQGYDNVLPGLSGAEFQMDQGFNHLTGPFSPDKGQPWFLHVHVTEPHVPYNPPESYLGELAKLDPIDYDLTISTEHYDARDAWPSMPPEEQDLVLQHMQIRYRAEIAALDDILEAQLERYDAEGLLDDTLVVVWNDHGEQFWEHGHLTHAYDLYRPENDGILFFWAKNIEPAVWTGPTVSVDMVPTVLDAVQVVDKDWRSGEVIGTAASERIRFALSVARSGVVASVTRGTDRLMLFGRTAVLERYDLAADPDETTNLYGQDPVLDGELLDLLSVQVDKAQAANPYILVNWPE